MTDAEFEAACEQLAIVCVIVSGAVSDPVASTHAGVIPPLDVAARQDDMLAAEIDRIDNELPVLDTVGHVSDELSAAHNQLRRTLDDAAEQLRRARR